MNLAWGKVRQPADVVEQPTLVSRGAIVQMDDRAGGTRPLTQSPYRFPQRRAVCGVPHHIGESTMHRCSKIGWVMTRQLWGR